MTKCYDLKENGMKICVFNTKTNGVGWIRKAKWISFAKDKTRICWHIEKEFSIGISEIHSKIWELPEHLTIVNCDMEE